MSRPWVYAVKGVAALFCTFGALCMALVIFGSIHEHQPLPHAWLAWFFMLSWAGISVWFIHDIVTGKAMSEPAPEHIYESTACHHNLHDRCRRSCKFCASSCICKCHLPESDQKQFDVCGRTADVEGPQELIADRDTWKAYAEREERNKIETIKQLERVEAKQDALRIALEQIRKHQELISGQGFFPYSAVWRIADAALKSLLAPAPPVTK